MTQVQQVLTYINPFRAKDIHLKTADAMAPSVARPSAAMILTMRNGSVVFST